MMRVFSLLGICCCCIACSNRTVVSDSELIKQNIRQAYMEVLNEAPELKNRIGKINKDADNPDMMIRELKEKETEEMVQNYCHTLTAEGYWKDLNYDDQSRSGWQPSFHAARLLEMAKAYRRRGTAFFNSSELSEAIHRGINYWFAGNFRCTNWWYNEIGVPKLMGGAFLLMEDEMNEAQKEKAIQYMENARFGRTGQNSVWLAENVLVRALLQQDTLLVRQACDSILQELKINETGEGIRPDLSFQQHGAQLQFGNYGLAFANTMAYWARIFKGTSCQLNETQSAVLRRYLLGGMQWIMWKGYMDVSSCGRQLFRNAQEGKALSLGKALQNMKKADPGHAADYEQFYKTHVVADGTPNQLTGFRYFPYSDFGVYRTSDWCVTVKMSSNRVIGSEIVNTENLQGDYLGDGAMFVYQQGDEYKDIFPVWNWKRIPGITYTLQEDKTVWVAREWTTFQNKADFVGGLSDGQEGIMAMELNHGGITGRKCYFFMDKQIYCIGNQLQAEYSAALGTSVAQCLKQGEVLSTQTADFRVCFHNGVRYLLPRSASWQLDTTTREGNWKQVALFYDEKSVKAPVFSLQYIHSSTQEGKEYSYVVQPGVAAQYWCYLPAEMPSRINETLYTGVWQKNKAQYVFYAPAEVVLPWGQKLKVEDPCLLMATRKPEKTVLWIAEPTWKKENIRFEISSPKDQLCTRKQRFEAIVNKGKTVKLEFSDN